MKEIIFSGYSPYPRLANDSRLPHIIDKLSNQIHKTALGAESIVPFRFIEDIGSWLTAQSSPIVALEQATSSTPLDKYRPPKELILLLGEEVNGIPQEILRLANEIVEIPMSGQKESFNVSVAAAIALYAMNYQ